LAHLEIDFERQIKFGALIEIGILYKKGNGLGNTKLLNLF